MYHVYAKNEHTNKKKQMLSYLLQLKTFKANEKVSILFLAQ